MTCYCHYNLWDLEEIYFHSFLSVNENTSSVGCEAIVWADLWGLAGWDQSSGLYQTQRNEMLK